MFHKGKSNISYYQTNCFFKKYYICAKIIYNMIRKILLLSVFSTTALFAQDFVWQAGVHSFFNNNEFNGCTVKTSQTMAGVHFVPQIGLSYQDNHRIYVGIDAMHEFGSDKAIDYYNPVAYYQFDGEHFNFYMGAFPRKPLLNNYPRMFFQDSVFNYRPVINGLFWEYRSGKNDYCNVWLDWTGRQSYEQRESFFMAWSGRYNYGMFYGRHFFYMFHFAGSLNPSIHEPVQDNGLILTSIGFDLAEKTNFEKLEMNIGWSVGLDRDRGGNDGWKKPAGFLSELNVEYRSVGLLNSLYLGQGQQSLYNRHQNRLYWGDPAYRASKYNRADFYVNFIKNRAVNVKLIYTLHFLESKMFHEQALYAVFDLDSAFGHFLSN